MDRADKKLQSDERQRTFRGSAQQVVRVTEEFKSSGQNRPQTSNPPPSHVAFCFTSFLQKPLSAPLS